LALSHAREKEELLNKLLKQKDDEMKSLKELVNFIKSK
jgi:DNA-binding helix-turn-helix protein